MTRILLVEDEKDLRLLMEHVLIAAGYVVETATTVEEAGSRLDRGSYDLVIADGKLADGTGMQIADRAVEQGARALIVTGYAFLLPREELMRYPYLLKPVRPDELLREVRAELHRNPG
jgi:DNA-binding response OmpR family regulator